MGLYICVWSERVCGNNKKLTAIEAYYQAQNLRLPPRFVAYRGVNRSKLVDGWGGMGERDAESSFRADSISHFHRPYM